MPIHEVFSIYIIIGGLISLISAFVSNDFKNCGIAAQLVAMITLSLMWPAFFVFYIFKNK